MSRIKQEFNGRQGAFYYEEKGKRLAEMVFSMESDHLMVIHHTEVDDALQGQGIGRKLLEALVNYVRKEHIKVVPLCPFANATFQKVREWQDVLETPM